MAKLWFKARRYGWGWTPVSVEGWIVTLVFLVLTIAGTVVFVHEVLRGANPGLAALLFSLWVAILGGLMIGIAYRTGEPPGWRWGD